jgi:transposase
MTIVGCDFHPSWQQIAVLDTETGEVRECKLVNGNGEAERFYRQLPSPSLIGVEACGNSQWFVDMLQGLGHEVWIGDAAQIRASYVRKQKTDRRDAGHILKLLMESRFPRLWTPSAEQRNLRQLLIHRHKLVGIRVDGEKMRDADPRSRPILPPGSPQSIVQPGQRAVPNIKSRAGLLTPDEPQSAQVVSRSG